VVGEGWRAWNNSRAMPRRQAGLPAEEAGIGEQVDREIRKNLVNLLNLLLKFTKN